MIKSSKMLAEALGNVVQEIGYGNVMMIAQDMKLRLTKKKGEYCFYIANSLFESECGAPQRYQIVDEEEVVLIMLSDKNIEEELSLNLESCYA